MTGGKWTAIFKNTPDRFDQAWMYTLFAVIGNTLSEPSPAGDNKICGAVVRPLVHSDYSYDKTHL
jgi:hypothetical protein